MSRESRETDPFELGIEDYNDNLWQECMVEIQNSHCYNQNKKLCVEDEQVCG